MPVSSVVVTPGSPSANSFVTVSYCDQFHLDRPGFASAVAWLDATADEKAAAVIYFSRRLSSLVCWEGQATYPTQALAFPRIGSLGYTGQSYARGGGYGGVLIGRNGFPIDSTTIPVEIQEITAEGAAQLLVDAAVDAASGETPQASGLIGLKAGPVELKFSEGLAEADAIPYELLHMLPYGWGQLRGRSMTMRLVRA